jgi:hypothetical protein
VARAGWAGRAGRAGWYLVGWGGVGRWGRRAGWVGGWAIIGLVGWVGVGGGVDSGRASGAGDIPPGPRTMDALFSFDDWRGWACLLLLGHSTAPKGSEVQPLYFSSFHFFPALPYLLCSLFCCVRGAPLTDDHVVRATTNRIHRTLYTVRCAAPKTPHDEVRRSAVPVWHVLYPKGKRTAVRRARPIGRAKVLPLLDLTHRSHAPPLPTHSQV